MPKNAQIPYKWRIRTDHRPNNKRRQNIPIPYQQQTHHHQPNSTSRPVAYSVVSHRILKKHVRNPTSRIVVYWCDTDRIIRTSPPRLTYRIVVFWCDTEGKKNISIHIIIFIFFLFIFFLLFVAVAIGHYRPLVDNMEIRIQSNDSIRTDISDTPPTRSSAENRRTNSPYSSNAAFQFFP